MSHRNLFTLVLLLVLVSLSAGAAFAQTETTKQVGLVVTFADGTSHREIVTVPAGATALDVLAAANVTVVTSETAFGPALCKINDTGCPADNCFCDPAAFWAYYHLVGDGWAGAMESAGAYVPAHGSVEGFAWSGFDSSYNPTVQPPVYTFAQLLAELTPAPVPVPEPATILLLGSGVAALAGYARRKRSAAA